MKIQDTQRSAAALANLDQVKSSEMLRSAQGVGKGESAEDDDKVAKQFETYFATMLVKEMRSSLPEGMFSGAGSDVYSSWFDQNIGDALASRDALGLASMIRTAIGRTQHDVDTRALAQGAGTGAAGEAGALGEQPHVPSATEIAAHQPTPPGKGISE